MKIRKAHSWAVSPVRARAIQEDYRHRVIITPLRNTPRRVAGVDVACPRSAPVVVAAVVIMTLPQMKVEERAFAVAPLRFPYIPGLLSFREGEVVLRALRQIAREPDILLFDGQGLCHPRRFGLASHLGVLLDRPSVGCAKSLLIGKYTEPSRNAGSRRQIVHRGEVVGLALRSRTGVKPVYVSVGHRSDLDGAVRVILSCCRGYRLPEPLREAHRWVSELSREVAPPLIPGPRGSSAAATSAHSVAFRSFRRSMAATPAGEAAAC